MADKYLGGPLLTAATANQCGRSWAKLLYVMSTEHWGHTDFDNDTNGRWESFKKDESVNLAQTVSGQPARLDIDTSTYTFAEGVDEGRLISIKGFTGAFVDRDGIYRIQKVLTSKIVILETQFGSHDAGLPYPATGLSWKLWEEDSSDVPAGNDWCVLQGTGLNNGGYNYQFKMTVQTSNSYFPTFEVGPFATWNAGSDAWTGKYTTARGFINNSSSLVNVDQCRVWAVGAADGFIMFTRMLDDNESWHLTYIGELDVVDDTVDPNAVILWQGSNMSADIDNVIGAGLNTSNDIYDGGRGLAHNESTTLDYYMELDHVTALSDVNLYSGFHRSKSDRTYRTNRTQIMATSRTASFHEERGILRRVYAGNQNLHRGNLYARNGALAHIFGGFLKFHNGSGIHEQRI
jgi:hypothetical protein